MGRWNAVQIQTRKLKKVATCFVKTAGLSSAYVAGGVAVALARLDGTRRVHGPLHSSSFSVSVVFPASGWGFARTPLRAIGPKNPSLGFLRFDGRWARFVAKVRAEISRFCLGSSPILRNGAPLGQRLCGIIRLLQ